MPEIGDEWVHLPVKAITLFKEGSLRTLPLSDAGDIQAVRGKLKSNNEWATQKFLFKISAGWTMAKAKAWVRDHKEEHSASDTYRTAESQRGFALHEFGGDAVTLVGYASTLNTPIKSVFGIEVIKPGAWAKTLQENDAAMLWAHDRTRPLARVSAGNLRLSENSYGLYVEADLTPDTTWARDAISVVKSGIINAMSVGFTVVKFRPGKDASGEQISELTELRLHEVSPVVFPGDVGTSIHEGIPGAVHGPNRALSLLAAIQKQAELELKLSTTRCRSRAIHS